MFVGSFDNKYRTKYFRQLNLLLTLLVISCITVITFPHFLDLNCKSLLIWCDNINSALCNWRTLVNVYVLSRHLCNPVSIFTCCFVFVFWCYTFCILFSFTYDSVQFRLLIEIFLLVCTDSSGYVCVHVCVPWVIGIWPI